MIENPYRLLTREGWSHGVSFGTKGVLAQEFVAHYLESARSAGGVDVCVVDHPIFDQIRAVNCDFGVPTVIASQNIESLDVGRLRLDPAWAAHTAAVDLANELRSLSLYDARLVISKVEASLLMGIGLTCQFYPYLPCGEIRTHLSCVAAQRLHTRPERDLFLVVGTANHAPTRRSLEWFVRHAVEAGLPKGARVVVVGTRVQELLPNGVNIPGLELRGRVSEEEFADLLIRTRAALVPQRMGFGALTRIPELACAGVPVVAFPHPSYALDIPPGVQVLKDDSWSALVEAMRSCMEHPEILDREAYEAWERQASRPLGHALRQLTRRQPDGTACRARKVVPPGHSRGQ